MIGLTFVLFFGPLAEANNPNWADAVFRPRQIVVSYPGSTNRLQLSWNDGKPHNGSLTLELVSAGA